MSTAVDQQSAAQSAPITQPTHTTGKALAGRTALVTGGNRGIGAAICRSLAAEGANIAAGYSRSKEQAEGLCEELHKHDGINATAHCGNVGVPDDCRRVVHEVIEQHGGLDILINNAGITSDKSALKMADDDWFRVLAVNLSGAFFTSQAALPHMLEKGFGRIINISSIVGQQGNIGQSNYAASKSGIFGLTRTMAREAAHAMVKAGRVGPNEPGVTVNAVAPGFIETDMLATVPEKVLDAVRAKIPIGRLGQPEEIGRVVRFLSEDGSAFITGQLIAVNGGMEM
jgi:NAD(P)-dependent dehydrogenase (short-subunit alcohol dehydrogenase family)